MGTDEGSPRVLGKKLFDVGFMLAKSKNRSYRNMILHQATALARFLASHQLILPTLYDPMEGEVVPCDFTIYDSDVEAEGIALLKSDEFYSWLNGHDRGVNIDNVCKLEKGLQRIRNSGDRNAEKAN